MNSDSTIATWVSAGPLAGFPEGQIVAVELDGRPFIVVHTNGAYLCFDDACAHQPVKLSEFGLLAPEGILMCQAHGACFDLLKGGAVLCPPACESLIPRRTKIEGSNLQILLN